MSLVYLVVRLWDPPTRLLLLRVPREDYPRIRASLTMWTHLAVGQRIVASVRSVHGSARTAKRGTLGYLRKLVRGHAAHTGTPIGEKEYQRLQTLVLTIQGMD